MGYGGFVVEYTVILHLNTLPTNTTNTLPTNTYYITSTY